jgi:hypothetical protein
LRQDNDISQDIPVSEMGEATHQRLMVNATMLDEIEEDIRRQQEF